VSQDWEDEGRNTRRKRRRRRKHKDGDADLAAERRSIEEEALLTPEERAYQRARRIAEEKTRLASEALPVLLGGLLALFVFPFAGVIILVVWGWRPAKRAYRLFIEPALREHLVEQEVERQVHATLSEERRSLETEHSRSMQNLSASIAHEIRNPITAAKSLVQQMEEDPTSRENTEYARVALEELQRVERSVSHLLRFARDEEMGLSEVPITDVIDSALETFRERFERAGVHVEREIDAESHLRCDPEKLRRVIINLVGNAVDALEESDVAAPRLEIAAGENLAGTEVWVRIKDNGPGIPDEIRQQLFSPFYTSKANGTGLGLPICRKLIDAHGGTIEVDSQPGAGAEFLITLPKQRREPEGSR
jgi:signal transduction histidine kinase